MFHDISELAMLIFIVSMHQSLLLAPAGGWGSSLVVLPGLIAFSISLWEASSLKEQVSSRLHKLPKPEKGNTPQVVL